MTHRFVGITYSSKYIWPALASVAQCIECRPANRKVAGAIPSQGTCLGCRPGPQVGAYKRKTIDVSFFLPPFPFLYKKYNLLYTHTHTHTHMFGLKYLSLILFFNSDKLRATVFGTRKSYEKSTLPLLPLHPYLFLKFSFRILACSLITTY